MRIEINTFNELIAFIEAHNLSSSQMNELVRLSLKLIVLEDYPKEVLIAKLKTYWSKYKDTKERPIFLDINLDVIPE